LVNKNVLSCLLKDGKEVNAVMLITPYYITVGTKVWISAKMLFCWFVNKTVGDLLTG